MLKNRSFLIICGALMLGIAGASAFWLWIAPRRKMPDTMAQKMGYKDTDEYQTSYKFITKICPGGILKADIVSEAQKVLEEGSPNAKGNVITAYSLCSKGVDAELALTEMLRAEHDPDPNVRDNLIDGLENYATVAPSASQKAEQALQRMATSDKEPVVRAQAKAMIERFHEYRKAVAKAGHKNAPKNE